MKNTSHSDEQSAVAMTDKACLEMLLTALMCNTNGIFIVSQSSAGDVEKGSQTRTRGKADVIHLHP